MTEGFICPNCGRYIEYGEIKVIDKNKYEGVTIDVFKCPLCKEITNDWEAEPYYLINKGDKCYNCEEIINNTGKIDCSKCKLHYFVEDKE